MAFVFEVRGPLMSPVIPGGLDRNRCYRKGNDTLIFRNHALSPHVCVRALRTWVMERKCKTIFFLDSCHLDVWEMLQQIILYSINYTFLYFISKWKGALPLQCLLCAELWEKRVTLGDVIKGVKKPKMLWPSLKHGKLYETVCYFYHHKQNN